MKLKNLPLIYLEWCDATSKIQAWNTYEEAIEWAGIVTGKLMVSFKVSFLEIGRAHV